MRKIVLWLGIGVGLFIIINEAQAQQNGVFIYGKVTTVSGDAYTGALKWGNDEVYWQETFNAVKSSNDLTKYLSRQEKEELSNKEEGNSWLRLDLSALGIWENRISETTHQFDVRFGDLKAIEPAGRGRVKLTLKNGAILEAKDDGHEDIGSSISVYDFELGEVKLSWSRVDKVEFMAGPEDLDDVFGQPIFGVVNAGRKGTFKGIIQWDSDERFMHEILDGKDRNGDKKVPFRSIQKIEKGREGVDLTLRSGRTFFLTGSNDVNSGNRGIVINDPEVGQIKVLWRDFIALEIVDNQVFGLSYNDFPTSKGLTGTVVTIDGQEHKGLITYDLDESWEFEILDAKDDKVDFKIPFRNIKSIVPKNYNYSMVTLKSGQALLLGDSRDVSDDNDGILVFKTREGEPVYIKWSKIDEIIFD